MSNQTIVGMGKENRQGARDARNREIGPQRTTGPPVLAKKKTQCGTISSRCSGGSARLSESESATNGWFQKEEGEGADACEAGAEESGVQDFP
jgi:hypothetical protein